MSFYNRELPSRIRNKCRIRVQNMFLHCKIYLANKNTRIHNNKYIFIRYGICVDVDECVTGSDTCDRKSETCMNLPGRFKCICRWGFMWSTNDRTCVPDVTVKNAEIRLVSRTWVQKVPSVKCVILAVSRHNSKQKNYHILC